MSELGVVTEEFRRCIHGSCLVGEKREPTCGCFCHDEKALRARVEELETLAYTREVDVERERMALAERVAHLERVIEDANHAENCARREHLNSYYADHPRPDCDCFKSLAGRPTATETRLPETVVAVLLAAETSNSWSIDVRLLPAIEAWRKAGKAGLPESGGEGEKKC